MRRPAAPLLAAALGLAACASTGCASTRSNGPGATLELAEPVAVTVRTPKVAGDGLTDGVAELVSTAMCSGLDERGGANLQCRTEAENRRLLELTATRMSFGGCDDADRCGTSPETLRTLWEVQGRLERTGGRVHLTARLMRGPELAVAATVEEEVRRVEDLPEAARRAGARLAEAFAR